MIFFGTGQCAWPVLCLISSHQNRSLGLSNLHTLQDVCAIASISVYATTTVPCKLTHEPLTK